MSTVSFFSSVAALPAPQCQSDASLAVTFSVAGPSLMPGTFASATVIFLPGTGFAYCSEASVCSAPPWETIAVTDFRPAPASATSISKGAVPMTSACVEKVMLGGSDSRRWRKCQAPAASAAKITTMTTATTIAAPPRWELRDSRVVILREKGGKAPSAGAGWTTP